MRILKLSDDFDYAVEESANVLKSGGSIVYPTDTCYGIRVNTTDKFSVFKLYKIKSRDASKPTHVVVRGWDMIEQLCHTNYLAKKLYDKYLPGPLTIVLSKKTGVLDNLTGGLTTLGVRIPDSIFTHCLSNAVDFPYTTPSANRTGELPPYSIDELKDVLDISLIDLVIDGGKLSFNPPSTLVDVSEGKINILREGPIKL